jgi:stage V sporulation protein R
MWFSHTNRRMLDEVANHAARIRRYIGLYGLEAVENFLDACLSLDNLIDIHAAGVRRRPLPSVPTDDEPTVHRIKAKEYMDEYINPPEFLAAQQEKLQRAREQSKQIPEQPERDALIFLMEYAPLENWQRDVLAIVREEAYYFAPQRQSKVLNEGWASFWHSTIMTQKALEPNELIDYAEHHSGTVAAGNGRLNPYRLGLLLLKDIEDRWNRGAFGAEYERCDDRVVRKNWDKKLGRGREKIFEVRRIYNDVGFIDAFLTEDFAREQKLFAFDYNKLTDNYEISSRDFAEVKRKLLFQLTNFGQPLIDVVDANLHNRGELLLAHRHEGIDLDILFAEETLKNLYVIWGRPVHLETAVADEGAYIFTHGPEGSKQTRI